MSYSFLAPYYHKIFPARAEIAQLLLEEFKTANLVADFGCGLGTYGTHFKASSIDWIGYELDPEMIKLAHLDLLIKQGNLLEMAQWDESWDGAYCIGNVISYLNLTQVEMFLNTLYQKLPQGSRWIFQTMNWDYVCTLTKYGFPDAPIEPCENGWLKFRRWYENIHEESLDFHRQLLEHRTPIAHAIDTLYPLSAQQVEELHQKIGFKKKAHYADFFRNGFDPKSDTASVWIFEK